MIKPSILPGFMELLPREEKIFEDIKRKISKVYEEEGCLLIDTPIIEKSEVLLSKEGGETEKQVYRFNKGKNDLTLRFDLTVPFSRYVAQYYDKLTFPFKRYQIGKVYRGERNQKGRYREFYQCDLDVIGNGKLSINNDGWVISTVDKAFKKIGLENYQFQISNRKILKGILEELEIKNEIEVMNLIDRYEKISREDFEKELEELIGEKKEKLLWILDLEENIIENIKNCSIENRTLNRGIEELERVVNLLRVLEVKDKNYKINLKIIRGLNYYTGTVFETILIDNENYGSICSGGRYDNLSQNYTDRKLPGVGISIGLTRLFFVLKEIGFIEKYKMEDKNNLLILPMDNDFKFVSEVQSKLKEMGFKVSIYLEEDSFKKKIKYADKISVDYTVTLGEQEKETREIVIKNMITGEKDIIKL